MNIDFSRLQSLLLPCTDKIGFRDPTAVVHDGKIYCFYSYIEKSDDGFTDFRLGLSVTDDLVHWQEPVLLTERDRRLNYSSPGNIIRKDDEFLMCFQTYPTAGNAPGRIFGNSKCRLYTARSKDLLHWSKPELMRVHGDETAEDQMGRMIDPFIVEEQFSPGNYLVFYKQPPRDAKPRTDPNGYPIEYMSYSATKDLKHFEYKDSAECGENVCVLFHNGEYLLYHSPQNGIGCYHTKDFRTFSSDPILTFGQADWHWAQSRITAGFVLDGTQIPGIGKYLMLFHGDEPDSFPFNASIGVAWSDDLICWCYR